MTTHPIALDGSGVVVLQAGLALRTQTVDPDFWTSLHGHLELQDGRVLSVFDYESDWTWWERHPVGDELAYVLTGEIEFLLERGGGQQSLRLAEREAGVIPEGIWHSARVAGAATVLFVTPAPTRTEHRGRRRPSPSPPRNGA